MGGPDEGISVSPNNKKHLLSSNNSTSAAGPANHLSTAACNSGVGGLGQASNNNHRDVSSNNVSSSSHIQTQFNHHHTDLTQQVGSITLFSLTITFYAKMPTKVWEKNGRL